MSITGVFWLALILGIPTTLGILFLVFPERIIQWRARGEFEWRKDLLKMSDQEIDQVPMLPTDRYLVGQRSKFVSRGRERPGNFPRLIWVYRLFGIMFLSMAIVTGIILWQFL